MIYVVDDEQNIRDLLRTYLTKEGYKVETFSDGELAYKAFESFHADMLIIDIMMPGMDGYTLCKEIRKISDVPIIMVSAKDDEIDRVLGLELGSDDYISKPFSPREMLARVKSIFRRMKVEASSNEKEQRAEVKCLDIVLFPEERRVVKSNEGEIKGDFRTTSLENSSSSNKSQTDREIEMTAKEYDLFYYLVKNKNKVFNREQLINNIWGYDFIGDTRAIDDLVKRVRKKLSEEDSKLEIITVWGYGYKICD